jgi:predicted phosphohydrolase
MKPHSDLLWVTDLHLETLSPNQFTRFLEDIKAHPSKIVVITGDISLALLVERHLIELSNALPDKKICFTLGNHDFFGGSIEEVEARIDRLCNERHNLIHLDGKKIIPLSDDTALLGHRGWADARAGLGNRSWARNADFWMIKELRGSRQEAFKKIAAMGDDSAKAFREILPLALTQYRSVVLATHVPPFRQVLRFGDQKCKPVRYPHFVNISAGMVIGGIAKKFPERKISVLCGHTHTPRKSPILHNLTAEVGAPRMMNTLPLAA